jgi:hypothetical protein
MNVAFDIAILKATFNIEYILFCPLERLEE